MANSNKKRTEILRVDPEFKKWIEETSRFKTFQEKEKITPSRITKAMFNQWKKYPELQNELKQSKLGKWKSK